MNQWALWEMEKRIEKAGEALTKNGFTVETAKDAEGAADIVTKLAENARTAGFGGSVTAEELQLPDRLSKAGVECLIHGAPGLSVEERLAVMRRQLTCDLFVTGANAVTLDGKLVNIDATGNRVGALTFGPAKAVVIAGGNKLVRDAEEGVRRIREVVAPANAKRLGFQTPCAVTGFCADCASPQRICRVVHILEKKPRLADITVVLVAQSLGI